jgi:glycolate oxidase FAD binding subunit
VRLGGATAQAQAEGAARLLRKSGLEAELLEHDAGLWEAQREGQRGAAVVRVSGLQSELARTMRAAERAGGTLVGRASLGLSWISLPPEGVEELRRELQPRRCVVLDAPRELREQLDVWQAGAGLEVARRIKRRFDPANVFAPGTFVGGL